MKLATRHLLVPALMLALASAAHAFDLTVEVVDAKSERGTVDGALFGAEANWLRAPLQGVRQPAGAKAVLVYRDLPAGAYALSVFHDENGNGKLDTNVAGIPLEPFGFSRDARGRFGPPPFADAAIDLQADTTITIHLR